MHTDPSKSVFYPVVKAYSDDSPTPKKYAAPLHVHEFSSRFKKVRGLKRKSHSFHSKFFAQEISQFNIAESKSAALGIRRHLNVEWDDIHQFRTKGVQQMVDEMKIAVEELPQEEQEMHLKNLNYVLFEKSTEEQVRSTTSYVFRSERVRLSNWLVLGYR